eukprot:CAMPEP_0176003542 /NCGR_PEP_ID=MMETSP0120_2-20121206/1228_1 /TAXON_ID=160619 /ORGANISM="Kryptoperidinium foliaceum, Strain CCMP 1326" /LENGTH=123 /DNA_ID=CAMNT_0017336189 /DNA_START=180 /DNA_END=548 /DNA_ORIENTATION=-
MISQRLVAQGRRRLGGIVLPTSLSPATVQRSHRSFHATSRQDILPVIAVGALALIGRYSWKALNRMDEEWEDYQWALQQYERQRRKDQDAVEAPLTIGVDIGWNNILEAFFDESWRQSRFGSD